MRKLQQLRNHPHKSLFNKLLKLNQQLNQFNWFSHQ
jgi:hypothetical protein